jgi:hypothetical protein
MEQNSYNYNFSENKNEYIPISRIDLDNNIKINNQEYEEKSYKFNPIINNSENYQKIGDDSITMYKNTDFELFKSVKKYRNKLRTEDKFAGESLEEAYARDFEIPLKIYKAPKTLNEYDEKFRNRFVPEPTLYFPAPAPEPQPRWSNVERKAHTFRSTRIRMGDLGTFASWIQTEHGIKAGVSALVRRSDDLFARTQDYGELHRAYIPLLAGIMSEPGAKSRFLSTMDNEVEIESDSLKAEARTEVGLTADVIVIGAGVQASIFASKLRSESPETRIVAIDKGDTLGGQFRSYGQRPVFFINSRNHRRQDNELTGLPGNQGNLNSFGQKAPVQITDLSYETYPTNLDLGDTAALNQFLAAETMLGSALENVEENTDGSYTITVRDTKTNEKLVLHSTRIVIASGLGERKSLVGDELEAVWSAEQLFKHFGDNNTLFPMDMFIGKRVAIVGGGDSGRVAAELLARLGPKEAYGKSAVQMGGVEKILWFGTEFKNREEFCQESRPRYQRLASFITKTPFGIDLIAPDTRRVKNIIPRGAEGLTIILEDGSEQFVDYVIDATNLTSTALDPLKEITGEPVPVSARVPNIGTTTISKRIGKGIYLAGPVARLPLTLIEKTRFAEGIKENTASIWANQTRTEALALTIAKDIATKKRYGRI